jgi:hypothetical protein
MGKQQAAPHAVPTVKVVFLYVLHLNLQAQAAAAAAAAAAVQSVVLQAFYSYSRCMHVMQGIC